METIYRHTRQAEPFMWFVWCMAVVWGIAYSAMPQTNFKWVFAYWLLSVFILEVILTYTKPLEYDFKAHNSEKINTIIYLALFICPRVASLGAGVLSFSIFSKLIDMPTKGSQDSFFTGIFSLLMAEICIYIASFQSEIVRQSYLLRVRYVLILLVFGVSLFFQKI